MEANIWKSLIIFILCGACNCIYRRTHFENYPSSYPHENVQRTVYVSFSNMCDLDYEKDVEDKPDIFATISNRAGLCRIKSQENHSTTCYVKELLLDYIDFVGNIGFFRPSSPDDFDRAYRRVVGRETNLTTSVMLNGLNYDAREQSIFFLATQHHNHLYSKISKIHFNHSDDLEEILEQKEHELTDLAYDWTTKNMYMNGRRFVSVVNVNKTLSVAEVISNRSDIQSLVVHPNKGYLFFIERKNISFGDESNVDTFYAIYRSNLDGSSIMKLSADVNETLTSLGIDYYTDRLYWALPNSRIIKHAKLDGNDVQDILEKPINGGSHSLSLDKKYLYYVQAENTWVRRFNKTDHVDDQDYKLTSFHPMADIKVYDADSQKIRDNHPCLNENGGCHQYCFAIPKDDEKLERVCGCSIKEKLSSDGVSCESTHTSV